MALKATVFKAMVQIADMDRRYYADHVLTLARHPSETDEHLMVRLLGFVMFADYGLAFGKGLSSNEEPDLWQKDLTGEIKLWLEVGLPDAGIIRRACGRPEQVVVLSYGRIADICWSRNRGVLKMLHNLTVLYVPSKSTLALAALANRTMQLQFAIQEGHIMMTSKAGMIEVEPQLLHGVLHSLR